MKKHEIHVGTIYTNDRFHRLVRDEGPQFAPAPDQKDMDYVEYVRLDGRREPYCHGETDEGLQVDRASRASLASWATRAVTKREFSRFHAKQIREEMKKPPARRRLTIMHGVKEAQSEKV